MVRVFAKALDPVWVGSIEIAEEVRRKIEQYLSRFDEFEEGARRGKAEAVPGALKTFMEELFRDLEQDIAAENHQKTMAQTEEAPQPVRAENPKIEIKHVMSRLHRKLRRLVEREARRLKGQDFGPGDLLSERRFQKLRRNTLKILRLLDMSDFKSRTGYQQLKQLLEEYMAGDTAARPRLRRKNCLIEFKRLLLRELELDQ